MYSGNTKNCGCRLKTIKIDIIGQKYGRWTVIQEAKQKGYARYLRCLCDCGQEKIISMNSLRTGKTKSCGCLRLKKHIDVTGQQYGRLTAVKEVDQKGQQRYYLCNCTCGSEKIVAMVSLRSGKSKSTASESI